MVKAIRACCQYLMSSGCLTQFPLLPRMPLCTVDADSKVVDQLKLLEITFFDDVYGEAIHADAIPFTKRGALSFRIGKIE